MTSLRSAYFFPRTGSISTHSTQDGYARTRNVLLDELPDDMRQIAEGALAWLAAQLPAGMQELTQVILERGGDVPTAWSEPTEEQPAQPTEWSASFNICITGEGYDEKGERLEKSDNIQSQPGELTDATATLWDYLAAL